VIEPVREQPVQVVVTDKTSGQTRVIDRIIEPAPPIVPPAPEPDVDLRAELAGFLRPEIEAGLVDVLETGTQVTVRISAPSGSSLFASGNDKVSPAFVDVIERIRVGIAEQQARIPGDIIVVGHTDSVPIKRSLRFQDNRDLSLARATSVAKMLAADKAPPITNTIEKMGKGADDPVDGNDPVTGNQTAEQRARNRRVEILIEK
jgi:type VI secretion system protein ImpK